MEVAAEVAAIAPAPTAPAKSGLVWHAPLSAPPAPPASAPPVQQVEFDVQPVEPEPAKEIGPIPLVKGSRGKALQNLRYTNRQAIEQAKTLDDIW